MNKWLPTLPMIVKNIGAVLIAGLLASLLVRQFPAYKKFIDNAFLP